MRAKNKKPALVLLGAAVVIGTAAVAAQKVKQAQQRLTRSVGQWHPITVNRDIADVTLDSAELQPLRALGDAIELTISPAPGNRGTEIAARIMQNGLADKDARTLVPKLRAALRNTQWLLETGEILRADVPPSTHRTLTGLPLDFATRHAREGGRL